MEGMTMGGRILGLRRSKKMSQQDLATAAGISVTYLSELENDARPLPGAATVSGLAAALGTSMDYIFSGTATPPSVARTDPAFRLTSVSGAPIPRLPVTKESQTRHRRIRGGSDAAD
jgi:transcriptional regulator with XRE-family HTH domain